jgi:hypothetical protein
LAEALVAELRRDVSSPANYSKLDAAFPGGDAEHEAARLVMERLAREHDTLCCVTDAAQGVQAAAGVRAKRAFAAALMPLQVRVDRVGERALVR